MRTLGDEVKWHGILTQSSKKRRDGAKRHLFHFAQDIGLAAEALHEGLGECYFYTKAHADQIEHCQRWTLLDMESPLPFACLYRAYLAVDLTLLALMSMELALHRSHGKKQFDRWEMETHEAMNALRNKLL